MTHTILLLQPTEKVESRSWSDYESVSDCLEGICKVFEEYLRKKQPHATTINYDISELFGFIDRLTDLSILVYDPVDRKYEPRNKDTIKENIFGLLRNRATKVVKK